MQARKLLGRAAKKTAGIGAEPARAHAEDALAETALWVGDGAQAKASLEALAQIRERFAAKVVTDPDLVRATAVAASLDQWHFETRKAHQLVARIAVDGSGLPAPAA